MTRSCARSMDVLRHGCGSFPRRRRSERARAHRRIAGSLPAEGADVACSLTSYGLTTWLRRFGVGPDTVEELADLGG